MTPFGKQLRKMRASRHLTQKQMARDIGVSAAYLSALENGKRGVPNWAFIQRIIGYFNVIWDEAEELQKLALSSNPRVLIDTSALPIEATELTNLLEQNISGLTVEDLQFLCAEIIKRAGKTK